MAIALSVTTRYANGFDLTISGAVSGETSFEIEFNREADFTSDDSLIAIVASSPVAVRGMPHSTPWNVRARSVSLPSGPSAWSNVVLVATSTSTEVTAYAGFSIEKALLVVPEAIANLATSVISGTALAAYPVTNLLRDDPGSTFRWSPGGFNLDFDTAEVPIDTIALLGTMANDDATWRIRADATTANRGTGALYDSGLLPLRCSPTIGRRQSYHALQIAGAPVQAKAWRVTVNTTAPQFLARNLVAGLARRSVNASRGSGSVLNDQGTATRTRYGAVDRAPGWRGRAIDFELSWVREQEYQTKWGDLMGRVGKTLPVLVVANSKRNLYLNDRIGYGPITSLRAENVQSFYYSQPIEVDSIY